MPQLQKPEKEGQSWRMGARVDRRDGPVSILLKNWESVVLGSDCNEAFCYLPSHLPQLQL